MQETATARKSPKPLDRNKLLEDCDDETEFANRCLQVFVRETQVDIDGISAAFDAHDFDRLARHAHRIKGASASIRASFLQEEAARLQAISTEGKEAEACRCFARLRVEFEHFKRFIVTLPPFSE
jgi:HPt (histidine-containing phosphotransfer) domain-containing protein